MMQEKLCKRCNFEKPKYTLEFNGDELCEECYVWANKKLYGMKKNDVGMGGLF